VPTVPELLRHDVPLGHPVTVVLRSGYTITGRLDEVDLVAGLVHVDGWALRADEIAGVRTAPPPRAA